MEEKFTDILEKDEKIIKVIKPNKCKFWAVTVISTFFCCIWYYLICIGSIPDGGGFIPERFWFLFKIASALFAATFIFTLIFASLYYKNRFYAYSNKRIIIRGGIIGVDYKSLEYKHLGATIVNVSLLDKILGRNTGSIRFGSPSSPVGGINAQGLNPYTFCHIVKPYDTLREIKEVIDSWEKTHKD